MTKRSQSWRAEIWAGCHLLYYQCVLFDAACGLLSSLLCWGHTLYCTGWLIRLGIFFFFAITARYVTGPWRQCYIIPHGFTASERDSWERRALLCPSLHSTPPQWLWTGHLSVLFTPAPHKTGLPRDIALQWKALCEDVYKAIHSTQYSIIHFCLTNHNHLLLTLGLNYAILCCTYIYIIYLFSPLN